MQERKQAGKDIKGGSAGRQFGFGGTSGGHIIRFTDERAQFSCREGVTLLAAMRQAGLSAIPVGCRAGGCGACKIKIMAGEYERGAMSRAHISPAEQADGYALACRVFPRSDMQISCSSAMGKT